MGALFLLAAAICVRIIYGYSAFLSDFGLDYGAALALRRGISLYSSTTGELFKAATGIEGSLYFHPPFAALWAWPFSFLSYKTAFVLVGFGSLLLLSLSARMLGEGLLWPRSWPLILLAGLYWFPVWACLATGQVSMLVAFLIIAAWLLRKKGYPFLAGGALGLAALLKLYPGLFLLFFIVRREKRALAGMLACGISGLLLTFWAVGWDDLVYYAVVQMPLDGRIYAAHPLNLAPFAVLSKLFGLSDQWVASAIPAPELQLYAGLAFSVIILAGTVWVWLQRRDQAEWDDLAFGLSCTAMLLISPIVWQHYLVVMLLPVLLLLRACRHTPVQRNLLLLALMLLSLPDALLLAEFEDVLGQPLPFYYAILFNLATAALLGIYLSLWLLLRRQAQVSAVSA